MPQFSFDDASARRQRVSVESFSYDPDGSITKVEWDFDGDQDFDDGDANEADSAGGFTYISPGTKTIWLRVTDDDNATSSVSRSVTVGPLPDNVSPVANFAFQPAGPVAGQQVTVESFSHDPDGNVTKVEWDFDGDGDFDDGDDIETDKLGGFTYTTPGTKTIRLRVTDNDGASSILARELTVAPAPPNKLPVVGIAVSPKRPKVGEQTSFQAFAYDPDGSVAAQGWDLDGDGGFDEDVTGPSAFTTFTTLGERVVRLQVRDNEGALQPATVDVDVQPAAVVRPSALGLLTPFPIVRLSGASPSGGRASLLEVPAHRGARHRALAGRLPAKPLRKTVGKRLRFRAMQRVLRPGTVFSVGVTKAGASGSSRAGRSADEGAQAHRQLPVAGRAPGPLSQQLSRSSRPAAPRAPPRTPPASARRAPPKLPARARPRTLHCPVPGPRRARGRGAHRQLRRDHGHADGWPAGHVHPTSTGDGDPLTTADWDFQNDGVRSAERSGRRRCDAHLLDRGRQVRADACERRRRGGHRQDGDRRGAERATSRAVRLLARVPGGRPRGLLPVVQLRPRRHGRHSRVDFDDGPGPPPPDFDDGDANEADAFGTFTFSTPGDHLVRLRVTDDDGATHVLTRTVTVGPAPLPTANQLPVALFAIAPLQPNVGEQCRSAPSPTTRTARSRHRSGTWTAMATSTRT